MFEQFINYIRDYNKCMDVLPMWVFWAMSAVGIWSVIWKGIALWKASENNSKPWFIALLIINTVGILEILYIFFFSKKAEQQDK